MQRKIADAFAKQDMKTVSKYQRILVGSFAGQMVAMRSVFLSQGICSPGVDGLANPTLVQFWMLADLLKQIASHPALYIAKPVRRV